MQEQIITTYKNHTFPQRKKMKLYTFTPYASEGETFAEAISRHMNKLNTGEAAVICDHDIMIGTDKGWYPRIEAHLQRGMQFGTCLTNLIGASYQKDDTAPQDFNDKSHAKYAADLAIQNDAQYDIITEEQLASGHLFVITKEAWDKIQPLETRTILELDNEIHRKMKQAGIDLWLMRDVYVYHRYRFGDQNDTAHLMPKAVLPSKKEQKAALDPTMRKALYTIITGNYDTLMQPQVITPGWEYHVYTDNPDRITAQGGIWQVFPLPKEENSTLQQRQLKTICPIKAEQGKLLRTIYIDGNQTIIGNLDEFVQATGHQWGGYTTKQHPGRNCAYDEAAACIELGKDTAESVNKTVAMLKQQKFPKNAGLSETGIMIRDYNDPSGSGKLSRAMQKWEKLIRLNSHRDQLTHSFVLYKHPTVQHMRSNDDIFKQYFKQQPHTVVASVQETPVITKNEESKVPAAVPQKPKTIQPDFSEKFKLNIYGTVNEQELGFIPQFLEKALGSNPEAHVELVVVDMAVLPDIAAIEAQYPGHILIRRHDWLRTEANGHWGSYRYLIEPETKTEYVITCDIQFMLTADVLQTYLPLLEQTGQRYFNTVQSSGVHMRTEKHFTEYGALYGHDFSPFIPEVRAANSATLLLRIVESMGNELITGVEPPTVGRRMEKV